MSNTRNASLILKSNDLTANSITSVGESNQFMTKMTWYNINLRTLLGEMYDKYDEFNICMNTFATALVAGNVGASVDDRAILLKMTGLPWLNQTYDVAKGHNTNSTYIGTIYLTQGQSSAQLFYGSNLATFGKNQELVNITLTYERIVDNALPTTVFVFPASVFIFDIIGIDNYPLNVKNTTRIGDNLNTYF